MPSWAIPHTVEVDSAGLLLLSLSNGMQASIDCSWGRPTRYPRWGHLKMEIIGETGTVVMDSFAQYLILYSSGASRNPSWVSFGPDPNQAMRVALAAYESSLTKSVVAL